MALVVGTVSIGRAGLDAGVTIEDPQTQEINGDQITWTGFLASTSLAGAKALRQQLLGYVDNPDELWVPVVCSWDPSLTGFYRVLSASVGGIPGVSYTTQSADLMYNFPYSVTVEQVVGFGSPVMETTLIGALRTNASSITATNMTAYLLETSTNGPTTMPTTGWTAENRTSADGADIFYYLANPTLPINLQFAVVPTGVAGIAGSINQSIAKIESQALDGATYRTVIGRQLPYRHSVSQQGHDWRLSNGYVRVAPAVINGADNSGTDITVAHYDGTGWDTAVRYTFTIGGAAYAAAAGFRQIAVLRNDPRCVSIRLGQGTSPRNYFLDLTLRRGSRFVECRWSSDTLASVFIVARATNEAATAITGGIRATANDASGNRYVLAAAQATTNDVVNGKITSGSVTAYDFMIGSEVAGSGATGGATAQNQIYQWICAQSETYRLVGR